MPAIRLPYLRRRRGALTCRELVELIGEYLDGALPAAETRRFEAHIAACGSCSAYLEQIRTTAQALGGLTEEAIPAAARDELLAAFARWRQAGATGH